MATFCSDAAIGGIAAIASSIASFTHPSGKPKRTKAPNPALPRAHSAIAVVERLVTRYVADTRSAEGRGGLLCQPSFQHADAVLHLISEVAVNHPRHSPEPQERFVLQEID